MEDKIIYMPCDTVEAFMRDAFVAAGVPAEDAALCANVLISADKRGIDSHGVGRLCSFYLDRIRDGVQQAVTPVEFVRKSGAVAVVDGHAGMAMVVAKKSMEYAMECARKFGVGIVAVRNSSHFGRAGYYADLAAKEGMIGFCVTNARPAIAPTFSTQNKLGTNPIAFTMPSDEEFPFAFDCATSVAQRGKIELYGRLGKDVPPGWVIDVEGKTRTDTQGILADLLKSRAALAPLGGIGEDGAGYKGYGFATVVELLSCALQQGYFLSQLSGFAADGSKQSPRIGHFLMAFDIEHFTDLDSFKKRVGDVLRELRAARKAPGQTRIYTAGEKEYLKIQEREKTGIAINTALRKMMLKVKADYKLDNWQLPFTEA